jgi:hypothetical protein
MAFDRHACVARDQQQAAEDHRLAHAQETVGQQPADHRHAVHQSAVGAEHVEAGAVAELVVLQQVQQQQRFHSVEGEALPHLGEEADEDALGMPEDLVAGAAGDRGGEGAGAGNRGHADSVRNRPSVTRAWNGPLHA